MSTQYNGVTNNVTLLTTVNISSSTNTNPITVTTAAAHNLTTGDYVDIVGHHTNTSANGVWPVTVLSPTRFSIPFAGVGVGVATGTVQSLALGATYAIPSDGDADAAASVDVALETLGDRTAVLAQATGYYKLAALYLYGGGLPDIGIGGTMSLASAGATWGAFSSSYTPIPVVAGDLVEISWSGTISTGAGPTYCGIGLGVSNYSSGASPVTPTSILISSGRLVPANTLITPVASAELYTCSVSGSLAVWIMGEATGGTCTMEVIFGDALVTRVWRATGMLQ